MAAGRTWCLPAGWSSKLKRLKKATKARKWVQDIIRHTSIAFQTERDKNEALTAFNCGTSIAMMNRHRSWVLQIQSHHGTPNHENNSRKKTIYNR